MNRIAYEGDPVNRAIENRLIDKLLALNLYAPQWRHYFLAANLFILGAVLVVVGFIVTNSRESVFFTIGAASFYLLGLAFVAIGKLVRDAQDAQKTEAEQTKRLAEQDERIRTLEAQLAALSKPIPAH